VYSVATSSAEIAKEADARNLTFAALEENEQRTCKLQHLA